MNMEWKLFYDNKSINEESFRFARNLLKNKRIVIADDNGGTLKWLKFTLEDYGVKVFTFKHGKETIEFVYKEHNRGKPVDILILDIHMNKIGGLEIARANQRLANSSSVIFLTGCGVDSREFQQASEISTLLQKPVGMQQIMFALLQAVVKDVNIAYGDYIQNVNAA